MDDAYSGHTAAAEITFARIVFLARSRWYVLVLGAIIGLALALGSVAFSTPVYTVSMVVIPTKSATDSGSAPSSLAKATGLSQILSGGQKGTSFAYYETALTSVAVAERVAAEPNVMQTIFRKFWDAGNGRFRAAKNMGGTLLGPVYGWFGIKAEALPSSEMLRDFLQKRVKITENKTDGSLLLSMDFPDPKFAEALLRSMHKAADDLLRAQAEARSEKLIDYLNRNLRSTDDSTVRTNLIQILLEQDRDRLMSQPGVPYAAEILDDASSSDFPTSPKPIIALPLGIVVGIILAVAALIALDTGRRRAR